MEGVSSCTEWLPCPHSQLLLVLHALQLELLYGPSRSPLIAKLEVAYSIPEKFPAVTSDAVIVFEISAKNFTAM